jgi:Xaa-Pro aminopeptidase
MTLEMFQTLQSVVSDVQWMPTSNAVEALRCIKDASELENLRRAAEIADMALDRIETLIRPGTSERTLAIELEHAMRENGAEALSFPTIVASGPRGSLPHAEPSGRCLGKGDLVTIDFGAVFGGYHSDETVTLAVANEASVPHQRVIYDIVYRAQKAGIDMVKPGVLASDVDAACRAVITDAGYGEFFGHGTGHGVGLEVHEDPFLRSHLSPEIVLEAGMVITVEPGIYLPEDCGVRLEDTLVVTEAGSERLTQWDKSWHTR